MFEFIRQHQRWMQFILILLILPSFVFFGVQGYSSFMNSEPELASVDGKVITLAEFNRARRSQLEQFRSMLGGQFDPSSIDTPELRQQILNTLIDQRTILVAAEQGRFSVSDETLRRTIASIPAVQVDGQFSPERYRQVLASQGLKAPDFEAGVRRDLALAQVLQPVISSALVPAEVVQKFYALITEKRVLELESFNLENFRKDVSVSDSDIKVWYDKNQESLKIPESVNIDYLVVNETAASKDISVSDAEIEAYYKQNEARYGQPERRRVSHILIEVPVNADAATKQKAQTLATDLAKRAAADPKAFAALAKEYSQDPGSANEGGDLGWISKNMLVQQVEGAVFSLDKGKISDAVESPFGYHVIFVTDVQAASVKPLAEVKADIVAEITKQIAADRFAELAAKMTNLIYDQRDSLKPVADALGLQIKTANGLSRNGLLPVSQGGSKIDESSIEATILGNPKVRQTAFSTEVFKDKLNSGAVELSPDTIVALRVSQINPARVPPLADVSEQIRETLIKEGALTLAKLAGNKALEALKASAVASSAVASATAKSSVPASKGFQAPITVTRQSPASLSREQLDAAMGLDGKQLPQYVGVTLSDGFTVIRLSKIEAGAAPDSAQLKQLQGQLSQAWGTAEEQAALKVLQQKYKVKILPEAAKVIAGQVDDFKL